MTVTRKCVVLSDFLPALSPGGARACKAQRSGVTGIEAFAGRREGFLTRVNAFAVPQEAFLTRVKAFVVRQKAFLT